MNLAYLPFGLGDVFIGAFMVLFYVGPLVVLLLALKWLYQSKRSLGSIESSMREISDALKASRGTTETEHERN